MLTVDASVWVAAFDPSDRFHIDSLAFLREVATRGMSLHAPEFALIEVACATARRSGDAAVGRDAGRRIAEHPALTLHPLDHRLASAALDSGLKQALRGADALYAGTAVLSDSIVVAWDAELVSRTLGQTPRQWLDAHKHP